MGGDMAPDAQIPIWLDCDPGHDDAFAMLLAAHHPRLRLLGVSTVFGNASLEHTTRNAAAVLTALGRLDVPLHAGGAQALARPARHAAADIHGASGLDGSDLLPAPAVRASAEPAVSAMAAALGRQPPGAAWLVATGALTNVAALLRAHPRLAGHLGGLSLMGGALGGGFSDAPIGRAAADDAADAAERIGNVTHFAEFNMFVDPEAAAEVLANPLLAPKTTVVPLDLSHQVLATDEVRQLLLYGRGRAGAAAGEAGAAATTTLRRMLVELLYFFAKTYSDVFGLTAGPPLHDPIAVAAVLIGTADEIPFAEWDEARSAPPPHRERFDVAVLTDGSLDEAKRGGKQTGRMLARPLPAGSEGVRIPRSVDVAKFWQVIEECLSRADAANAGRQAER